MSRSNLLTRIILSVVIIMLAGIVASADTIKLKDGTILKGKVVSYGQRKFTIVVNIGGNSSQYVIPVEDVESVEFEAGETGGVQKSAAEPQAQPAAVNPPVAEAVPETRPVREREPVAKPPVGEDEGSGSVIAEKTVSVAAGADWTSTDIRVQRGQKVVINAAGEVDLGDNQRSGPEGINSNDTRKLLPNRPTGALIAVVGDDNDDFIFIGASTEFVAPHNGILFLSVNEGNLKDNNGAFVAKVKVLSPR
ncbi:MAG: hypothetical protein IPL01_18040 [Acidobacteria bacterium]|nr:hypothetical protein [Acidobacteriota bacterium]